MPRLYARYGYVARGYVKEVVVPTQRELILRACKALLQQVDGVAATSVFRTRTGRIAQEEMPAINLMADGSEPAELTNGGTDQQLTIVVEVYACGNEPDAQADPMVDMIHALLMADTTLGGLCIDITEAGTTWDTDDSDKPAVKVTMRFRIWHRHSRNNLSD